LHGGEGLGRAAKTLEKTYDDLERRVEERTAEVINANEKLDGHTEEREQAEKSQQLEASRLKAILDAINEGVYIANRHYDIEYVNPVIEKAFGPVNGPEVLRVFR